MPQTTIVHNIARAFRISTGAKKNRNSATDTAGSPVRLLCVLCALMALPSTGKAQWNPLNPVNDVRRDVDGVVLSMSVGTLRVRVAAESIVRVTYSATAAQPESQQYMVTKTRWPAAQWTLQPTDKDIVLSTARLKVTITRKDGAILFSDSSGKNCFKITTEG